MYSLQACKSFKKRFKKLLQYLTTMEEETTPVNFSVDTQYTARVKWFNNRSGYGFATVTGGDRDKEDVFVHHSGIKVQGEQYKYLVQGEYVQFNLRGSDNERHPFQADNIRGINKGQLMCETHLEMKKQRENNRDTMESSDDAPPRNVRHKARERIRSHGGGPREGDQWFLVKRGSRNVRRSNSMPSAGDVVDGDN